MDSDVYHQTNHFQCLITFSVFSVANKTRDLFGSNESLLRFSTRSTLQSGRRGISFDPNLLPFESTSWSQPWSSSTSSGSPPRRKFQLRCTDPPRPRIACAKSHENRQFLPRDSPNNIFANSCWLSAILTRLKNLTHSNGDLKTKALGTRKI